MIKRTATAYNVVIGAFVIIAVISVSSWSFAGAEDGAEDSVKTFPHTPASQEKAIAAKIPSDPGKTENLTPDLPDTFARHRRVHYTLLSPNMLRCFAPEKIAGEIPNSHNRPAAGIYLSQRIPKDEPQTSKPALSWETGTGKSYLIPVAEIVAFNLGLNLIGRIAFPNDTTENGKKVYDTDPSTFWHNLVHGAWVIDDDNFSTNQLRHPYQGAIYQNIARSTGLSFWESVPYTLMGSFLWETGGETTNPSLNDMVASGIAGNFLGEALFRMASLLLEHNPPGFWRELAAAVVSPPTGFNRLAFGERFDAVFPSYAPAIFWMVRIGATRDLYRSGGDASQFERSEATADFSIFHGLPGKPGYHYTRPFDYFEFQMTGVSNTVNPFNPLENLLARGLLLGKEYEVGDSYRGIWGLYGSYDYISQQLFRVSSTAVSLGTTGQWWASRSVALQGSAAAGFGYGAGGNVTTVGERDYHYGLTGQGLLDLRLIFGDTAMLNLTQREYYITNTASSTPKGNDTIGHLTAGVTLRIFGRHALGLQYHFSARDGDFPGLTEQRQRMSTLSLVYTLLSDIHFGAVEWRRGER